MNTSNLMGLFSLKEKDPELYECVKSSRKHTFSQLVEFMSSIEEPDDDIFEFIGEQTIVESVDDRLVEISDGELLGLIKDGFKGASDIASKTTDAVVNRKINKQKRENELLRLQKEKGELEVDPDIEAAKKRAEKAEAETKANKAENELKKEQEGGQGGQQTPQETPPENPQDNNNQDNNNQDNNNQDSEQKKKELKKVKIANLKKFAAHASNDEDITKVRSQVQNLLPGKENKKKRQEILQKLDHKKVANESVDLDSICESIGIDVYDWDTLTESKISSLSQQYDKFNVFIGENLTFRNMSARDVYDLYDLIEYNEEGGVI